MELKDKLKELALQWGADLCGIADLAEQKEEIAKEFKIMAGPFTRGVSIAVFMPNTVMDEILEEPNLTYASTYQTANNSLDRIIFLLSKFLEKQGYQTFPIPASQIVGPRMDRGIFSHRLAAKEAGLGWVGKSCSIINPKVGPRLRLATLLTDAPLEPDGPTENRCGKCQKCVEICPVGAITGHAYAEGEPRDLRLDFDRCDQYLLDKKKVLGEQVCGLCIAVCPWGRKGRKDAEGTNGL